MRDGTVELYRAVKTPAGEPDAEFVASALSGSLPPDIVRAAADRLAARAIASGRDEAQQDELSSGGALVRTAAPLKTADGVRVGALVASQFVSGEMTMYERRATAAYE